MRAESVVRSEPAVAHEDVHIPRPLNSWFLFLADFRSKSTLSDQRMVTKMASAKWRSLSPDERAKWDEKAREAMQEHAKAFPQYKYRPGISK
ncbi:hypothetical protein BDW22DRAFT_1336484, partial [Trametopsis cervina]